MSKVTFSFEDKADEIILLLDKKRSIWRLTSVPSISYEDVKQIILIHIFKKWHMWDQSKPLSPWINTIIINQVNNLLRNNYYNFTRPCLGINGRPCAANEGGDLCSLTPSGKQCAECPLYAKWEKRRKNAYNVKIPSTIHGECGDMDIPQSTSFDYDSKIEEIKEKMKKKLNEKDFLIFERLYIKGQCPEKLAEEMSIKNKTYEQKIKYFSTVKAKFYKMARNIIEEDSWIR